VARGKESINPRTFSFPLIIQNIRTVPDELVIAIERRDNIGVAPPGMVP
jgi:hypothetical protein